MFGRNVTEVTGKAGLRLQENRKPNGTKNELLLEAQAAFPKT
jgi:hypothetical protein